MIDIYGDGACRGNPGPGGWATILRSGNHEKILYGAYRHTTNNRMELIAIIKGLNALKHRGSQVAIYSDSSYVVNAIQKGWIQKWIAIDFKKKKNRDLWQILWEAYQQHDATIHWVRGHAGHPFNERCDQIAVKAACNGPWEKDLEYEKQNACPLPPRRTIAR